MSRSKSFVLLSVLALSVSACSDSALDGPPPVCVDDHGNPVQIIAVTPYRVLNGAPVPACKPDEVPDGFALSLNLVNLEFVERGETDLQLREGDSCGSRSITVGPGEELSAGLFELSLGCAEPHPDDSAECETDDGLANPHVTPAQIEFVGRSAGREPPVAVAILVDHSSSMVGFGNQDRKEVSDNGIVVPGTFSDPTHSRYRAAIDGVVNLLDGDDLLIAYTFNEDGVTLACNAPGIDSVDADKREATCFGPQHDWVAGAIDPSDPAKSVNGAFTVLGQGQVLGNGRTPLWAAVDHAWSFLDEHAKVGQGAQAVELTKHIVVISDSPDTCSEDSPAFLPDTPCSTVSYADVRARIEALPAKDRIPLSFVQFQSFGYPEQDPAQMEAACLTGGIYQWVNRLALEDTSDDLETSLREALGRIRYTFGGVWRLYVEMDAAATLPPDRVYALDGELRVKPSVLTLKERSFQFRFAAPSDERLLLRRPCTAEAQCPGGAEGDCVTSCNPDGSVCAWPSTNARGEAIPGMPVGQGGACTQADVTDGTCCCGVCQESGGTCSVKAAVCCDPTLDMTCI